MALANIVSEKNWNRTKVTSAAKDSCQIKVTSSNA